MQATRGTPLSQAPGEHPQPAGRPRIRFVLLLALALIAVDQVLKVVAVSTLTGRAPVELFGGFLTLRLVRNPGAAFGVAGGATIVITVIAAIVVVVMIRMARTLRSLPWAVALGLLLGGAIGNLVDRVFRPPGFFQGHVIDYAQLPFTLVFNLADSAIMAGGALMVVLTFRGVPTAPEPLPAELETSPETSTATSPATSPDTSAATSPATSTRETEPSDGSPQDPPRG